MPAQRDPYELPAIRAFAAELTAWRVEAGLSKIQLAEALGYTPQLIGQFETCKNIPSKKFAEDTDTFFKTNGVFVRLWKLIDETRHLAMLPPGFPDFVDREAEAARMYVFEFGVINGLFQTHDYAYEVMKAGRAPEDVEQLVTARLDRQKTLDRHEPSRVVAVFDEMAIRRMIGGRDVMREQIEHLIELAQRPNITIQIVPADTGAYAGFMGAFTILSFDDDLDLVYTEGHIGGQLTADRATVGQYAIRYDLIRGAAMSADESLNLLRAILENL
jgi:hypothetical protein